MVILTPLQGKEVFMIASNLVEGNLGEMFFCGVPGTPYGQLNPPKLPLLDLLFDCSCVPLPLL